MMKGLNFHKAIIVGSLAMAILALPWSIKACHASLGVFLIAWIAGGQWRTRLSILRSNYWVAVYVIFLLLHLIGITYSENVNYAWFNIEKKVSLFILPVAMITTVVLDRDSVRILLWTFVLTCFAVTVFCLIQPLYTAGPLAFNFDPYSQELYEASNPESSAVWMRYSYIKLASAVGIHPTFLSIYLLFCLLVIVDLLLPYWNHMTRLQRGILVVMGIYFLAFILLLASRLAILSALFILPLAVFFKVRNFRLAFSVFSITVLVLISFSYLNPVTRYRLWQEPTNTRSYIPLEGNQYTYSMGMRISLWNVGIHAARQVNPIFGTGIGDVAESMSAASRSLGVGNILNSRDPHNEFLIIQIALGFIGQVVFLACLVLPARVALGQGDYFFLGFIALFTLLCITTSALESQKGVVFFSIFTGLFAFRNRIETKTAPVS